MTQQPPSISKEERERALELAKRLGSHNEHESLTIKELRLIKTVLLAEAAKVEGLEGELTEARCSQVGVIERGEITEDTFNLYKEAQAKIAELEKELTRCRESETRTALTESQGNDRIKTKPSTTKSALGQLTEAPNLRCSNSCFECMNNRNRLDRAGSERIQCRLHEVPKAYISTDWVCDDWKGMHE